MTNPKQLVFGVGGLIVVALVGRFVYSNIIVPAPYREDLKACLSEAELQLNETEVDTARNVCFRTYPHFN